MHMHKLSAVALQRRYSVVKVEVSQTYEKGKPKSGGLSDLRMGTLDRTLKCETDGAGVQDSPGYFGHIELAKPMFHIGFVTNVVKVLRCVSFHSSKLLIDSVSHSCFCRGQLLLCACKRKQLAVCKQQVLDSAVGTLVPFSNVGCAFHAYMKPQLPFKKMGRC